MQDLAGKWILKSTNQKMWEDGNHVKLIVSCYGNFLTNSEDISDIVKISKIERQ